jgi:hypothetical protein
MPINETGGSGCVAPDSDQKIPTTEESNKPTTEKKKTHIRLSSNGHIESVPRLKAGDQDPQQAL